ncbi:hypothetical protein PBC5_070 [Bacillus phage PBC5]|nr:hypothetical protein PBC5_070 [Bacillus phage PBC5]
MSWKKFVITGNLLNIGTNLYLFKYAEQSTSSDYFGIAAILCSVACMILIGTIKEETK